MNRLSLEKPVAFVLGGGGSLGALQVGMLDALAEHNVVPDLVVGTSVGALNGAIVAAEPSTAARRLAHIWRHLEGSRILPRGVSGTVRMLRGRRNYAYSELGLARVLHEYLPRDATFKDLAVPLHVVATDVASGAAVTISSGPLVSALLASAALPGVYPPVARLGRLLYDGGLVANVPVRQAVRAGARSLVVLDCTFPVNPPIVPRTLTTTMLFAATALLRQQTADALASIAPDVTVLYIPGPPPLPIWPLDFRHTPSLIETGHDAAWEFIEDRQATLGTRDPVGAETSLCANGAWGVPKTVA
jgi:NTE family protein